MKIAFVGGGNMANAIIGGLLQKGFSASEISVVDVDPAACARLREQFHVTATPDLAQAVKGTQVALLAVKPQQLREVARNLRPHLAQHLLISIAAGIRTADLSRWLGGYTQIVRAMPNTPALVLAGVSALYAMAGADAQSAAVAWGIRPAKWGPEGALRAPRASRSPTHSPDVSPTPPDPLAATGAPFVHSLQRASLRRVSRLQAASTSPTTAISVAHWMVKRKSGQGRVHGSRVGVEPR